MSINEGKTLKKDNLFPISNLIINNNKKYGEQKINGKQNN